MNATELANRLRIARQIRGMSINDVAQASGLNRAVIGRMCGGEATKTAQSLNIINIHAYAKAVCMPIEHLMGPLDCFANEVAKNILWFVKEVPDAIRNNDLDAARASQKAIWCAACGKMTDHGSGTCPTITHPGSASQKADTNLGSFPGPGAIKCAGDGSLGSDNASS